MLEWLHRQIDLWTIELACGLVEKGRRRTNQKELAEQLLSDPRLFLVPGRPAENFKQQAGKFTFESGFKSPWPENNLVHGRIQFHGESRGKPGIILLHGWNCEVAYQLMFPKLEQWFADEGFLAASIELPFHRSRKPSTPGAIGNFLSDDLVNLIHAIQQAFQDICSLGLWMKAQGATEIYVLGFSLGGYLAGAVLAHSQIFRGGVLITPMVRVGQLIKDVKFCEPIRSSLAMDPFNFEILNLTSSKPVIPLDRVLLVQASQDQFISGETIDQLHRSWNNGVELWKAPAGHITIMMPGKRLKSIVKWLSAKANRSSQTNH
ncbi:MAG: alpha/beta fold hydrolase [Verrucomicrobiota bacterium]|nr:alpha/beta fold hydrolase [Verrucomicrobiota bacterium]